MSVQSSSVVKIRILKITRKETETHYVTSASLSYATCSLVCASRDHAGGTACREKGRKNSRRSVTDLYEKLLNTNMHFGLEQSCLEDDEVGVSSTVGTEEVNHCLLQWRS